MPCTNRTSTRSGDVLAGRYRLIDLLSESGGGRFWRAHDRVLERFVALPTIVTTWAKLPEEEFKVGNASATIIGMLIFVLLINSLAIVLRNRFEKKRSS